MIYRSLQVNARWKSQRRKLEALVTRLATKTEVVSFVREIHIDDIHGNEEFVEEFLTDLIPNLKRLDAFCRSPSERDFLQTVKLKHVSFHPLHLDIGSSVSREMVEMSPHMLREFHLYIPAEPNSGQMAKINFVNAIKHCPSVQSLEVYQQSGGCVIYEPWTGPEVRLDIPSGDKLSRPSEVRIIDLGK